MSGFHDAMAGVFRQWGGLAGRLMLVLIFAGAAFNKITNFPGTCQYMLSKMGALPLWLVQVLLVGAIVFLVVGSVLLALGMQARMGAMLLVIFLVAVTPIFHGFWSVPADQFQMQMIQFQKNLAIMGGLVVILAYGAGPVSLDERGKKVSV